MFTLGESMKLKTICGQRYLTNYSTWENTGFSDTRKIILLGFFNVNTDDESVLEHKLCPFVLPTYFTLRISQIDAKRFQQINVLTSAFYLILPHTIGPSNTLLLIIHCLLPAVKQVFSNGFFFSL